MTTVASPLRPCPTPADRCQMIAIASGKGGVGKTWLAISMAHALARAGRRVLLFDGDLGLANVDIQLGLMPDQDLGDVLTGRLAMQQSAMRFDEGGFDIIAGRSGSGRLANLPASRVLLLGEELRALAGSYDYILLDLGAGVERTVRHLIRGVNALLVATTDEPTSLTDAYAFIKLSRIDQPRTDMGVIVNMAASLRDGERTYLTLLKACEGFLKISPPLLGVIRRDNRVRDAIRAQTPILTRYPNADAARDVEAIAAQMGGQSVQGYLRERSSVASG